MCIDRFIISTIYGDIKTIVCTLCKYFIFIIVIVDQIYYYDYRAVILSAL